MSVNCSTRRRVSMGQTVRHKMEKTSLLSVKIDKFQPLVLKRVNRRKFSFRLLNKKKSTVSPNMAKILTVSLKNGQNLTFIRKSHYPIEILMKLVHWRTLASLFHVRNHRQDMLVVSLNGKCKFNPKFVFDLSQSMTTLTLTLSLRAVPYFNNFSVVRMWPKVLK